MAQVVLHTDSQQDEVKLASNNLSFKSIAAQQTRSFNNLRKYQSNITATLQKVNNLEVRLTRFLNNLNTAVDLMNELEVNIWLVKYGNAKKTGPMASAWHGIYNHALELGENNDSTSRYSKFKKERQRAGYREPTEVTQVGLDEETEWTKTCDDSVEVPEVKR